MKQHITKEQWDELIENKKEILLKYMDVVMGHGKAEAYYEGVAYETLNIGQMIEFLGSGWCYDLGWGSSEDGDIGASLNDDLCDDLWDEVIHRLKYDK